ncbi:hemerythrin domain-containing protein [Patulibacter sp. SYSU D01012]|uniref:hemerythrin domain-containing protein n=1 Tax=Patulibacter sp. SYSU D01012 TaxID=2817381 RepID=UPI001B305C52|nr:hemerythrin domain-containing protein [Patulibacter sp. SYSU D01012]
MKRDPSLVTLSHDHHQALFVAQTLRRADGGDAEAARAAFRAFWRDGGERHFEIEEQVLLPAFAEVGRAHDPLVLRALGDHVELRCRARRAFADGDPDVEELVALGTRLSEHVRLEERELFPLIEATLPAERLAALAGELRAAHDA